MIVEQYERLQRVTGNHFETCIAALKLFKAIRKLCREVFSVEVLRQDLRDVPNHCGLRNYSHVWTAAEKQREVFANAEPMYVSVASSTFFRL